MNTLKNQRGTSLVGLLMSMGIFGIAMMGLAGMGGIAINANASSGYMSTATTLAQDRLEYAKGFNFSSLDSVAGTEQYVSNAEHKLFSRTTTVTTDPSNPDIKTVTVTVNWKSNKHSVTMSTIITKAGI
jgi:Tfp pilus assembly protein PilV